MTIVQHTVAGAARCTTEMVVVADLDGTLTFDNAPPGPAVTRVLTEIVERPDIRLVLASSRPPPAVRRIVGSLTDRVDLLCCNGALRIDRDGGVERTVLPRRILRAMVGDLLAAGERFCLDYGHWFLASSADALPWMGHTERSVLAGAPLLDDVVKLSVASSCPWLARFAELAPGVVELYPHRPKGDLDVTPGGVTKATGLNLLLGNDSPHVVALGNDLNDRDLLARADAAIVVGDGLPELDRTAHVRRIASSDAAVAAALRDAVSQVAVS